MNQRVFLKQCYQGLKVWCRFPLGKQEATFQQKYRTTVGLGYFREVVLEIGGNLRSNCTVRSEGKTISKKGWCFELDKLPVEVAKQACTVVSTV